MSGEQSGSPASKFSTKYVFCTSRSPLWTYEPGVSATGVVLLVMRGWYPRVAQQKLSPMCLG